MRNSYKKIYTMSQFICHYIYYIEDSDSISLYWFLILIEVKCEIKSKWILYENKNSLSRLRLIWQQLVFSSASN